MTDEGLPPPPMSDDERAFRASLDKLVDWVRVEQGPTLLRAFVPAVLFVPLGGSLVGAALTGKWIGPELRPFVLGLGVLVTAIGPIWALTTLIRSMREDAYVAIRVDGLVVRLDLRRDEDVYAWEGIEDVRYDEATRAVRIDLASGEALSLRGPFSGVSERDLAQRIRDARRLAVWHRLTPRSSPAKR